MVSPEGLPCKLLLIFPRIYTHQPYLLLDLLVDLTSEGILASKGECGDLPMAKYMDPKPGKSEVICDPSGPYQGGVATMYLTGWSL